MILSLNDEQVFRRTLAHTATITKTFCCLFCFWVFWLCWSSDPVCSVIPISPLWNHINQWNRGRESWVSVVMEEIIISAVIIILLYHCWLYVVVVVNRITIQPKAGNAAYHTRGLPSLFKSLFNVFIITYLSLSIQKKMLCTQNQPIQIDTFFINFHFLFK